MNNHDKRVSLHKNIVIVSIVSFSFSVILKHNNSLFWCFITAMILLLFFDSILWRCPVCGKNMGNTYSINKCPRCNVWLKNKWPNSLKDTLYWGHLNMLQGFKTISWHHIIKIPMAISLIVVWTSIFTWMIMRLDLMLHPKHDLNIWNTIDRNHPLSLLIWVPLILPGTGVGLMCTNILLWLIQPLRRRYERENQQGISVKITRKVTPKFNEAMKELFFPTIRYLLPIGFGVSIVTILFW